MLESVRRLILLVEDNQDDELLAVRALRKSGVPHELVVARDGEEALRLLLEADCEPTVVLLDLKLPKVDGLEVLQRLRADERHRLRPVVVLSSSVEERDVARSYAVGANSYLRKPVDFAEFTEAMRQLALYWLRLNHCARAAPHEAASPTRL